MSAAAAGQNMGTKSAAMTRIVVAIVLVALWICGVRIYKPASSSLPRTGPPMKTTTQGREPSANIAGKSRETKRRRRRKKRKTEKKLAAEAANARATCKEPPKRKEEAAQQRKQLLRKRLLKRKKKKKKRRKQKRQLQKGSRREKKKKKSRGSSEKSSRRQEKEKEAAKKKKPSPPPKGTVPQTRADYENTLSQSTKWTWPAFARVFEPLQSEDFSTTFCRRTFHAHLSVELSDMICRIDHFVCSGYDEEQYKPRETPRGTQNHPRAV